MALLSKFYGSKDEDFRTGDVDLLIVRSGSVESFPTMTSSALGRKETDFLLSGKISSLWSGSP